MVEPPSLELIDRDFDLAHWLKQNVPESWKRAALRRAWESDPAISDYLDPARDYALDWNTPGGAPGYGPLSASDNVEEMVANIFGKAPEKPDESPVSEAAELRDDVASVRLSSNDEVPEASAAPQQKLAGQLVEPPPAERSEVPEPLKTGQSVAERSPAPSAGVVAAQDKAWPEHPVVRSRRRGGGATPL